MSTTLVRPPGYISTVSAVCRCHCKLDDERPANDGMDTLLNMLRHIGAASLNASVQLLPDLKIHLPLLSGAILVNVPMEEDGGKHELMQDVGACQVLLQLKTHKFLHVASC
jgi:hypothetical protein